jgi:hypothetical protein
MNESDIKVIGNCIMLPNGKSQVFTYSVSEYKVHRGMVFVLLDYPLKEVFNENVYALNEQGEIVWQIEKMICPGGSVNCPFSGINIDKKTGNLLLYNKWGFLLTVVPETGEILDRLFTK